MGNVQLYETDYFCGAAEGLMRPGGLPLTEHLLKLCGFQRGAKVVDVGCGTGVSAAYMRSELALDAAGVDISATLVERGSVMYPGLPLYQAAAEKLPFTETALDGVLTECSMSVMGWSDQVLREFYRVLVPGGRLAVADVYARQSGNWSVLHSLPRKCCLSGIMTLSEYEEKLAHAGFTIKYQEDHTAALKQFAARLIMEHGSLQGLWQSDEQDDTDCLQIEQIIRQIQPGYLLLVAQKETGGGSKDE